MINFNAESLKELIESTMEIATKPMILLALFLIAGALLFIPFPFGENHIFIILLNKYSQFFFFIFLYSSTILLAKSIVHAIRYILILYHYKTRSESENNIINMFKDKKEQVLYLQSDEPAVMSLWNHHLLTPETIGGIIPPRISEDFKDMRPFRLRWRIYKKIISSKKE
jgi:hypothetical protein